MVMTALMLATITEVIRLSSSKGFPSVASLSTIPTRTLRSMPKEMVFTRSVPISPPMGTRTAAQPCRIGFFGSSSAVWKQRRCRMVLNSRSISRRSIGSADVDNPSRKAKAPPPFPREENARGRRSSMPSRDSLSDSSKGATQSNRNKGKGKGKRQRDPSLPNPEILFSNNHLLLINKPAGYFSQPNSSPTTTLTDTNTNALVLTDPKCLLTKLKVEGYGGGSKSDFLLPMHRLDQPCTGVILLAKTSKAGTRVGNAFRKGNVHKEYYCVVQGDIDTMIKRSIPYTDRSHPTNPNGVYTLSGVFKPANKKGGRPGRGTSSSSQSNNKSVRFLPLTTTTSTSSSSSQKNATNNRICHLQWKHLRTTISNDETGTTVHLISVKTQTGAKHQVRAMLSHIAAAPVCGDLRYGAKYALPDKSVALHARSISLPTVKLGDMDLRKEVFVAPIPREWKRFFSLKERDLR